MKGSIKFNGYYRTKNELIDKERRCNKPNAGLGAGEAPGGWVA
jgi:hypothetical protein